jgi:altronate hydrolase
MDHRLQGFLRSDGRKGIRNVVVVVYLVECAHFVARRIVESCNAPDVQLIGFPGCYPNAYAARILERVTTHPNVGAALLVSLGCESMDGRGLADTIRATGRPVELLAIQKSGGTPGAIAAGCAWVGQALQQIRTLPRVDMSVQDLVVGTICGGSDATSGLSANPAVGRAFDRLVAQGATAIFEETGELIGCEAQMAARAVNEDVGREIVDCVAKAARYYQTLGLGSFAVGNAVGGLTTIEEKSLGAYSKSGDSAIRGVIKPGDLPPRGGLYLLDVVPDGEVRFGFPNISDNAEIVELIACGSHLILFTTGLGSVVGSAISPVLKVCGNPATYQNLSADMDINAGRILEGQSTLDEVGREIVERVLQTAAGTPTASERLGHQEFILTYKSFTPSAVGCRH